MKQTAQEHLGIIIVQGRVPESVIIVLKETAHEIIVTKIITLYIQKLGDQLRLCNIHCALNKYSHLFKVQCELFCEMDMSLVAFIFKAF